MSYTHYCFTGLNFKAAFHCTEHPKLLDRGLSLVCRFALCGQDTCLLCLLSLRLSMPGVEHTVIHTICYLQHSWLGQTPLWVGNGADKTCDLDTVCYVWSAEREREVDWWESVALLILVCVRKAAESHVAWKHVCLCVWWEMESFSASLILFNFKDKHQITSLNKRTFSFFDLMLHIKCHYTIAYSMCHFLLCLSILMIFPISPPQSIYNIVYESIFPRCIMPVCVNMCVLCPKLKCHYTGSVKNDRHFWV